MVLPAEASHALRFDCLPEAAPRSALGMPNELSVHTDPLWAGYGEDSTFRALLAR